MENILLIMDGSMPDANTTAFACYIANLTHSKLNTLFIENIKGEPVAELKQLFALPYVETITAGDLPENRQLNEASAANGKLFANTCMNMGVNHHIQYAKKADASDIISESRFTDLIILNPQISFKDKDDNTPTDFVTEILIGSECPVVMAPYEFEAVDELVFSYSGGRSAVYAIRLFAYLFPQLSHKKLTVLQIDEKPGTPFRENQRINTLLQNHFTNIVYTQLTGDPGSALFEYMLAKKNAFLVMGAYGKSPLANPFRHSRVNLLLKTLNIPVFIAHH